MTAPAQRVIAVIPARYQSTRFPGKPLALIAGRPMIQWVYERAAASVADEVLVATDDQRIADRVAEFGGQAVMTQASHRTGTDRIAEAICGREGDLIVNVQGDEPLIPTAVIDALIAETRQRTEAAMGTVAVSIPRSGRAFSDPNVVKVVTDAAGFALYFSRASIPFDRDGGSDRRAVQPLHHWGIYVYRRDFLQQFVQWPTGRLEDCEKLEQLRALEHGARIFVLVREEGTVGVDVPGDIARVEARLQAEAAEG